MMFNCIDEDGSSGTGESAGMFMFLCTEVSDESETVDAKVKCRTCSADFTDNSPVTLNCLHSFCLHCIKGVHELAIENGQCDNDILYCPQCADATTLFNGSVENIRPFFVANQVKDLHALSQMAHEREEEGSIINRIVPEETQSHSTQQVESIDSTSYTIEYPGSQELAELDSIFQQEDNKVEADAQGQEADAQGQEADAQGQETELVFPEETCPKHVEEQREPRCHAFHLCGGCETKLNVDRYCFDCGNAMCLACFEKHTRLEQSHLNLVCSKHDELVKNFCIDCKSVACITCHRTIHEGHTFREFCVSKSTNGKTDNDHITIHAGREHNANVLQKLEELKEKLGLYAQSMINRMDQFEEETTYLGEHILDMKRYARQVQAQTEDKLKKMIIAVHKNNYMLNDYETKLIERSPLQGTEVMTAHALWEEASDKGSCTIDEELRELAKWCNEETETNHESPVMCAASDIDEFELVAERKSTSPEHNQEIHIPRSISPPMLVEHIAKCREPSPLELLEQVAKCRAPSPLELLEQVAKCRAPSPLEFLEQVEMCRAPSPMELVVKQVQIHAASVSIAPAAHTQLWRIRQKARSVAILSNGSVLAVGRDEIQMYNNEGNKLTLPFPASELQEPWKLAVHQASSNVAVVDPSINGFTIFTPTSSSIDAGIPPDMCTWNCKTHLVGGANVPMSVTFSDDGNILLGTGSAKTILKYSSNGDLLWEKPLAHECYYIATDHNNRIITSGGGSVHIHDENGEELSPFPQDKQQLEDPWGVCTDSHNNIYVCELNRPMVVVFTSSGRYIREIQMNSWPRDIALLHDMFVIGTMHSIEVHQLEGAAV